MSENETIESKLSVRTTADIEGSITKKFKMPVWRRFTKAVNEYELVKSGDKICVCISGGKDSMLMAKLFQELKRQSDTEFELRFLLMDPGYSRQNLEKIQYNAKIMDVPIEIFETEIFDTVYEIGKSPCSLCARMRRWNLYAQAEKMGCNKIALGHHYDDVIETILMAMLYGAQIQTMMPKLFSTEHTGMELIRPMYLIREADIIHWAKYNGLEFLQCACRFTENVALSQDTEKTSKRAEVKRLIAELSRDNPFVEQNIFKSVENVCLNNIVAYKDDSGRHHFLDDYDMKLEEIRKNAGSGSPLGKAGNEIE